MNNIIKKCRQSYGDMKLSYKFTLVLLLTATVPVVMMACFFYGKLYDMVVSYTIRQEQDTSAQTAPYIEDLVQQIIDAHDGITDQEFFQILFHQPVNSPFQMFLDTNDAQYFHEYVENLIDSDMISGLQIYMDFPPQSVRLFSDDLTKDYFSPMSKARGTYWYGIFQGTQQSSLFCPAFYLGEREKKKYGDLAYITSTTFYYQGKARQAYIALYSSSDYLSDMLKDNLTIDGSVSYIINDRNAVVASSDISLSGICRVLPARRMSVRVSICWITIQLRNLLCPPTTSLNGIFWILPCMPASITSNSPNGLWLLSCLLVH